MLRKVTIALAAGFIIGGALAAPTEAAAQRGPGFARAHVAAAHRGAHIRFHPGIRHARFGHHPRFHRFRHVHYPRFWRHRRLAFVGAPGIYAYGGPCVVRKRVRWTPCGWRTGFVRVCY